MFINPLKIVDSIMALFRVDFSGRGELSERQQKVSRAVPFDGVTAHATPVARTGSGLPAIPRLILGLTQFPRCYQS